MPRPFDQAYDIGETLKMGFNAMKAAPLPLLVGAVIMQCSQGGGGGGNAFNSSTSGQGPDVDIASELEKLDQSLGPELIGVILLGALCIMVVVAAIFCLRCWVRPGYLRAQEEVLISGDTNFKTLFGASDVFWRMMGWTAVKGFISLGTLLVAALPGLAVLVAGIPSKSVPLMATGGVIMAICILPVLIYVGLGLYFGDRLIALDGMRINEALERSWDLAKGNRVWLFVYGLVMGLFSVCGMCLMCIGMFFTGAMAETAATQAFMLYTRKDGDLDKYWSMRGAE